MFDELESQIGHHFTQPALLERAMTHSSFANEAGLAADNEPLEFLGDSILGFVVSDRLVRRFPEFPEGKLSKLKSFLVSAKNLYHVAEEVGVGKFLRLGRGEEKTGGRVKPALLVDALEALIAAVYLDGGFTAAERFIEEWIFNQVEEIDIQNLEMSDPKSALQERLQALKQTPAEYVVIREAGPDHCKVFTVEVRVGNDFRGVAEGLSKKMAEQEAARLALRHFGLNGGESS
ncbi:MAG: ribonuclease III [Acidobacteriia bacterium]|nr:ribonuclease III [Terriglobia bacterium]